MRSRVSRRAILFAPLVLAAVSSAIAAPPVGYSLDAAHAFLQQYCAACHQGKAPAAGFDIHELDGTSSFQTDSRRWIRVNKRVAAGEMPPKGAPAPSLDLREQFTGWAKDALHEAACSAGVVPGPAPLRRLNRDEYTATVQDLLDIHLDIGAALPADGSGGEGFDNAAETLFLSPLHSEKYLELAKFAMDFAAKEYKPRERILIAKPGPRETPRQAARAILEAFLPRAFRRPVQERDVATYLALFDAARKQGHAFEPAVFFVLRAALVSPMFLFHAEPANDTSEPRPLDQYALASRLSYFLWGSMPDELLFDIASLGKMNDPVVLRELIGRMLRNDRSLTFAERFVEQWLRTRELAGDKAPDAKLFPAYAGDEELRSDIRFQPILFFREILIRNEPVTDFLDSKYTIGTSNLAKHYDIELPLKATAKKQPQWVELPAGSHRGGVLGMSAVLAVSSYPYRTSPVLRGAWILDSILGTPPPPPPPNVPALEEAHPGSAPKTVRERLTQHRADPVCAGCHSRIDPLGFALENYDSIGRWRTEENGKPVDNSGELPDGTRIQGPDQLKAALLEKKDVFLRNLTVRMLGYALGRGLTLSDSCAVDQIVDQVKDNNYKAQSLIEAIVLSPLFQYEAGTAPRGRVDSAKVEAKKP